MDSSEFDDFLENEEDVMEEAEWTSMARDGVIFLVDCTSTMVSVTLEKSVARADADTGFKLALLCYETFMRNKAISSADDMTGLVFMRTITSSSSDFQGIHIIQELDLTDAARILQAEELRRIPLERLNAVYGSLPQEEGFAIHEALRACQAMFNKASKSLGYKRIYLITDDPDPVGNQTPRKRQAIFKATDLQQSGIELEVLPVPQEGIDFNMETFYKQLIPEDDSGETTVHPAKRFDDLLFRVNSHEPRRRCLNRLPIFLVPLTAPMLTDDNVCAGGETSNHTLAIGAAAFCLVRPATLPKAVRLSATTNELVTAKRRCYRVPKGAHPRQEIDTDPANVVLPQDIVKGIRIGDRLVKFEKHEISGRAKQLVAFGIHILGFKPLKTLKPWYHLRTAQFLYPDEMIAKGSTVWFTTLLYVCLRDSLFAMAIYVQRRGLQPRFVALVPQAEKVSEVGAQETSPGFSVVFLPYKEDFKQLAIPKFAPARAEEVEVAKNVVRKLTINYHPELVMNPRLQRHYAELEALALDRPSSTEVPDGTLPDVQAMMKRAGKELEAFKSLIQLEETSPPLKKIRKASSLTVPELRDHVTMGTLSRLTVTSLKEATSLLQLRPTSTKKHDLIAAITRYFDA